MKIKPITYIFQNKQLVTSPQVREHDSIITHNFILSFPVFGVTICVGLVTLSRGEIISTWKKERIEVKASQKREFHFSRKLKVDQELLGSWRHSRLNELNGQRQVGRKLRHWFGDRHPAESGSHAAYVADMDYSVEHFPNLVLGHCLLGWWWVFQIKVFTGKNSPCSKIFGKHWILYCTLSKTQYLLT